MTNKTVVTKYISKEGKNKVKVSKCTCKKCVVQLHHNINKKRQT